MLVRLAALVAVDAPAVSYLLNLGVASEVGLDAEQVRGVLAAVAPIVGTPRVTSATGKIADALDVAIEIAELDEREQAVAAPVRRCKRWLRRCAPKPWWRCLLLGADYVRDALVESPGRPRTDREADSHDRDC